MLMNFNLSDAILQNSFSKKSFCTVENKVYDIMILCMHIHINLKLLLKKLPYTAKGVVSPH